MLPFCYVSMCISIKSNKVSLGIRLKNSYIRSVNFNPTYGTVIFLETTWYRPSFQ